MSEREIPPLQAEQAEISDYVLGRGAKVTRTVEMSDNAGTVWGYKIWYEKATGERLTLILERAGS